MLCDISGSMEPYARAYLQFLTCAAGSGPNAEAFVFATRLTRLTRALASRNPERAIQRAAAAAPDWSSGTRIGDALKAFNDRHGRRGMARGAVVVILSDGWERGDPALVGREMAAPRAARAPDRVGQPARQRDGVLGAGRRHGGGAAALRRAGQRPQLRGARRGRRRDRRTGAGARRPRRGHRARGRAAEEEPWASATPVPGQLGRDAERPWPEQGQHHAGLGRPMRTRERRQDLHLPGLRAARRAAASAGRAAARFCDLEEHNALTAHQERQRLASANDNERGGPVVANEAYRAVFLRVHPTGKMVLSLTTDVRRQGVRSTRSSSPTSSASPRSTSRSCPPTPTASASGTATTRAPSDGATAAISRATAKIREKGSCSRAWRSRPRPRR